MFSGDPAFEDYDHPSYAPIWEAAIELGLPISFHILTGKDSWDMKVRGPKVIQQIVTVRGNQNIIMMLVLGGVFERHPELRVVMVETDAGWLPHFSFRLDHAWERHRWSLEIGSISRKPSEFVNENIYVTVPGRYERALGRRCAQSRARDVGDGLPARRRNLSPLAPRRGRRDRRDDARPEAGRRPCQRAGALRALTALYSRTAARNVSTSASSRPRAVRR